MNEFETVVNSTSLRCVRLRFNRMGLVRFNAVGDVFQRVPTYWEVRYNHQLRIGDCLWL